VFFGYVGSSLMRSRNPFGMSAAQTQVISSKPAVAPAKKTPYLIIPSLCCEVIQLERKVCCSRRRCFQWQRQLQVFFQPDVQRRSMAAENPTWGAPRIHGELLKLGFDISNQQSHDGFGACREHRTRPSGG